MKIEIEWEALQWNWISHIFHHRVLCSTTCQRYDCRDFIKICIRILLRFAVVLPVHIHFHSAFFSCYCSLLTSFLFILSHFKNTACTHTHSVFTVDLSICISFNNKFFHSNIFTSFSIKYFHRRAYCMYAGVSRYNIVYSQSTSTHPPTYSHWKLFTMQQKKGKFATSHITSADVFATYLHYADWKRKSSFAEQKNTQADRAEQDSMMSDAMRAKYFCVGNNDQKS